MNPQNAKQEQEGAHASALGKSDDSSLLPSDVPFVPTVEDAEEIAFRFINGHFKNADCERPRIRIPADPAHDDDIRLLAFIRQSATQQQTIGEREARIRELEGALRDISVLAQTYVGTHGTGSPCVTQILLKARQALARPAHTEGQGDKS